MVKTFIFNVIILLLLSCQENNTKETTEEASVYEVSTEKWPKKIKPNAETVSITASWKEFNALENSFDAIYTVSNTEDLKLVLEDLVDKDKAFEKANFPPELDKAQIKSRQKVFHTFILQTKGDLIYSKDVQESVLKMIAAHNAMLNQMNNISSDTFDLKSFLEEK